MAQVNSACEKQWLNDATLSCCTGSAKHQSAAYSSEFLDSSDVGFLQLCIITTTVCGCHKNDQVSPAKHRSVLKCCSLYLEH